MSQHRGDFSDNPAIIKVLGVGGCGGNAVNRMVRSKMTGIEFIAMNTDVQALRASEANVKIQLGRDILKGLGTGGYPEKGREAASESKERIKEVLTGSDMVFITAGMGGGTGTGAAPIIAEMAKSMDILTVGVVTMPFEFELALRKQQATNGLNELKKHLDTLITIPNDKVFFVMDERTPLDVAYAIIDDVLRQAVQAVSEIITKPGEMNRDFNDVRKILIDAGESHIGMGEASGDDRARKACMKAMENPLLENASINGAKKILVNITTSRNVYMNEVREAMSLVQDSVAADAELLMGTVADDEMDDRMKITIVASGLPSANAKKIKQPKPSISVSKAVEKESPDSKTTWDKPAYLNWKQRKRY